MLVMLHVGRDAGAVRDIRAAEAHAMLADGRATLPDQPAPSPSPDAAVITNRVKQRRTR